MTTYINENEGKFIAATQRPDGTWRKARRVKQGYVPQEEVPLYESKGKQFANKQTNLPVGMCPIVAQESKEKRIKKKNKCNPVSGIIVLPNSLNTNQNTTTTSCLKTDTKTSEKQSKKRSTQNSTVATNSAVSDLEPIIDTLEKLDIDEDAERQEIEKKIKKLKKKIREIEMIEDKLKCGDLKNPEKDQLDKVKRKNTILKELADLEQLK